jgi:flagellar basal-body rod protein FlgC
VHQPAVNPVLEVIDMMQASRSYQANLAIVETARTAALKTLDLMK